MEEKLKKWVEKWLRKDNLLILLLAGMLLVVIALPTKKSGQEQQADMMQGLSESSGSGNVDGLQPQEGNFTDTQEYAAYLEERLEETLSQISGVGAVRVMITLKATQELVLEKDQQTQSSSTTEEDSQGGNRSINQISRSENTVYHSSGNNEPYVVKTLLPQVEGVVVVAQGAGTGNISRSITDVVQALFNVEAHKVKVVKMDDGVNISE